MERDIILTITMLVSDREDTIDKCLKSLQNLRKAVPSELIVVDTAGNQVCMDIVRQYTDQIIPFTWCDDFSAARNAGVWKANGRWLMFLDDDEWFENTKELEEFFTSGAYQKYNAAAYIVRNYLNKEGTVWKDSTAIRLAKREKSTRFEGKIHESISSLKPPVYYTRDYAHHYGYAFDTEQERIAHSWRNIRPLLERRKERPDDFHAAAQLIQEYMGAREYFSAIEVAKDMRKAPRCWQRQKASFTSYAVIKEIENYRTQQRFQDGYKVAKELLTDENITILARGCILNQMVGICYQLEKYGEAVFYIQKYEATLKEWNANPDYQKMDLFRIAEQYLVEEEVGRFSLLELHIHVLQEEWEEAGEKILKADWKAPGIRMLLNTAEDIVAALAHIDIREEYLFPLDLILHNPLQQEAVYNAVDRLEEAEKNLLLFYLSQLPADSEQMCRYHLQYAAKLGDKEKAQKILSVMQEKNFPVFQENADYWNALVKLQIPLIPYMNEIKACLWMELADRLWKRMDVDTCGKAYQCLTMGMEAGDIRFLYASALWQEKHLREKAQEWNNPDEIWNHLFTMAQYLASCAAMLYREDVFTGKLIEAIPARFQFAWDMLQANAVKEENDVLFARKVSDAAKCYPDMKEHCKKILRGIQR